MGKIVVTGAAGLVGQNLILRLKAKGYRDIVAIDKHKANLAILCSLHPDITVVEADLAVDDSWQPSLANAEAIVISHAQIGGIDESAFKANNVTATQRLLEAVRAHGGAYLVHLSSSVVNSAADDWYVRSKAEQELLVVSAGFPAIVLRPTLMFGWFDRKHVGWLARFMKKSPVFPVPGDGRFLRQPLFVGDLCEIIMACLQRRPASDAYNITGLERIYYIDLMRKVRDACGASTQIIRIPYGLFWGLLYSYSLVDKNPPFTTKQLEALVMPDVFEVIDWPNIFGISSTPLQKALNETFRDPKYSQMILEF